MRYRVLFSIAILTIITSLVIKHHYLPHKPSNPPKIRSSHSPKAAAQTIKSRETYVFNMLRDPALNQIPDGIRTKELALYASLPKSTLKSGNQTYEWHEAGPNDVGGRTRALGIDGRNSNIIIAGGVSGGIWKSTDQGQTWQLKNSPEETYSVTTLCQDTRVGMQDIWYYASGEFNGNSANISNTAYSGFGIYKSTDNGESWKIIYGDSNNPFQWDHISDYISKIKVDPIVAMSFWPLIVMD